MNLHLQTLALTLMAVSALFLLAFAYLGIRYRWSAGAGWWAVAAVCTMVVVSLLFDPSRYGAVDYFGGFVLLSYCSWLHWVGLRAHLRLPWTWAGLAQGTVLAWAPVLGVALLWPDAGLGGLVAGLCPSIVWFSSRIALDIDRHGDESRESELRFLRWQSWAEVAAALGVGVWVVVRAPQATDLSWFTALVPLYILPTSSRLCIYFMLYLHDLESGRRRDRRALQDSQQELQSLVHNLGAGVVVLDQDLRLQMVNRAARAFFSPLHDLVPGQSLPVAQWRLFNAEGQPVDVHSTPLLADAAHARDVVLGIERRDARDKRRIWALFNTFEAHAAPRRRVLTLVDITALRHAQEEQRQLQNTLADSQRMRALGTLAGGIAHDFNNILTAILGNAQVMQRTLERRAAGPVSDDWLQEQRESADAVATAARRGRELVRQILSYGRRSPMQWQRCVPADVVQEVLRLLRVQLPASARLRVDIQPDVPVLWADPTQLTQALLNLGTNAAHALPDGRGMIEYVMDRLDRQHPELPAEWARSLDGSVTEVLRCRVIDNGTGMVPDTLERMYEPFFSTKPNGVGTGLGLPVVQGVVHAHGGTIVVDSRPGQGTCFALFLPVGVAPVAVTTPVPLPPDPPPTQPRPSHHVMLVEDDPAVARAAQRVLHVAGHRCDVRLDPHTALSALDGATVLPDLLVLDYRMPGMDGFALAQLVRQRHPTLPMAMISAYVERDFEARAHALGLLGVWLKSDCVERLDVWVERALANPVSQDVA